jgi:hypothetical protein
MPRRCGNWIAVPALSDTVVSVTKRLLGPAGCKWCSLSTHLGFLVRCESSLVGMCCREMNAAVRKSSNALAVITKLIAGRRGWSAYESTKVGRDADVTYSDRCHDRVREPECWSMRFATTPFNRSADSETALFSRMTDDTVFSN